MDEKTIWGNWDDDGPYYVQANCSLREAEDMLDEVICREFGENFEVFPIRPHALVVLVHDCDNPAGCTKAGCRHAITAYEFYIAET